MQKQGKIPKNLPHVVIDNPKTPDDRLVWINIADAKKKEIEYLRKQYGFDLRHLYASLGKNEAQRPIVEQNGNYLFMILHFPVFAGEIIIAEEIEFFLGHGFVVTIHNGRSQALKSFFNLCKKDGNNLLTFAYESSAVLLYEILGKLIQDCFNLLDQNSIAITHADRMIFEQDEKKVVSQILLLRRNIVNFRKIMQNHKNILKKLLVIQSSIVPRDLITKYYVELIEHTKRIWEILENQKDMIDIFYDTNESMMNKNLSDIMKTLTIFSVIIFPLTMVAGIFGMNTMESMPFVHGPYGFWIILGIMGIVAMFMLLFFKKKRWL